MKNIVIYLPYRFVASTTFTLIDYLNMANIMNKRETYRIHLASNTKKVTSFSNIDVDCKNKLPTQIDALIIAGTGGSDKNEILKNLNKESGSVLKLIKRANANKALIIANCTSVFYLAESNLLNGKTATGPWWLLPEFETQFPEIIWHSSSNISRTKNIICTGAGFAELDVFKILLKLANAESLESSIRNILLLPKKSWPQGLTPSAKTIEDTEFKKKLVAFTEKNIKQANLTNISIHFSKSERTIIRIFKKELQTTPGKWIQKQKINYAKKLLLENKPIKEVCDIIGYDDISSFTRLFHYKTGLTPKQYQIHSSYSSI